MDRCYCLLVPGQVGRDASAKKMQLTFMQDVSLIQWCPCKKSRCEYPDCPLGDPRSTDCHTQEREVAHEV